MDALMSMNQAFIEKLNGILEENYQNENFGVRELAKTAGVSRSKLHRKLGAIKKISSSEYIKEFRLQKAYILLKKDVSTVSEIAYSVGFRSPSYFTTCFHDYFGFSPTESKIQKVNPNIEFNLNSTSNRFGFKVFKKITLVVVLTILFGLITYYVIVPSTTSKNTNNQLSIAVLPFKNFSDDQSNQYFADGIMDVIMSHLSSIEDFRVISRTTMEQYRETTKTVPEIGNDLNIAYVLEASVQKYSDKIHLVVQLIDAKNDTHLWSQNYERPYQDIFVLQREIAKEVAKQLELTLSPASIQKINKTTTENFKAFNMYLKGRFFWHRRTEEDLKKSIIYFEEAIKIDPKYALAYAGLADAYFILSWWGWDEDFKSYKKGKEYALKALSIDDKLAPAYATLGGISTWFDWNWNQAEKELKKAISLDPNYATAYQYYAELLDVLGKTEEAKEQIDLALMYNPNSSTAFNISSHINNNLGHFEKSIEDYNRGFEIKGESRELGYFKCYIGLSQNKKAFEHFKKMLPESLKNSFEIDSIFQKYGISGVLNNYITRLNYHKRAKNFRMASLYSLAGESEKALDYLEKSFKSGEPQLPRMNNMPEFITLKTDPRFIGLLEKMNLR